jgi:hypothetical protein
MLRLQPSLFAYLVYPEAAVVPSHFHKSILTIHRPTAVVASSARESNCEL